MDIKKIFEQINGKNYIAGNLLSEKEIIQVDNPSSGAIIGYVPDLSKENLLKAINNTCQMAKSWAASTVDQRYKILRKWQELQHKYLNELSELLTLEQGKTLDESRKEILYGESFIDWFACVIKSSSTYVRPGNSNEHKLIGEKEPIGPVAAITPWNFPSAMVTRKIAPALAAGCSVILKPSEFTPFSALAQAILLEEAGLPAGVLNVVTGDARLFGDTVCQDFRIRKLSFTGSTRVGKLLYEKSANSLRKLSLELGGNAPYIIFADSDLDKVSDDLVAIKLRSGGQSCTSPNRIFIENSVYDKLVELIAQKFSACKAGDGFIESNKIGPLINIQAIEKINLLLKDAKQKGAKIMCGGEHNGNFMEPSVIKDCSDDMNIFSTEIFGPVIACYSFFSIEEVLARANNTEYGLQSYLYSKDIRRANYMASKLDFSMVSINSSFPVTTKAPFSGRKASGFGVEGSHEGIDEYLVSKYINFNYD
jgi:succinate-semialdehyde dehydrogenase/glutarate-semialdehyde dehydrogenase